MVFSKHKQVEMPKSLFKHPIFAGWELREIEDLYQQSDVVQFQAEEYLFQRDQPCHAFYMMKTGAAQLQWRTKTGQVKTLHQRAAGDAVGDACILMGDKYRVDALATQPTVALRICRQQFYTELCRRPHLMMRLVGGLSEGLCYMFGDVLRTVSISGTQRVIHYLLAKVPLKDNVVVELNCSKAQVAASLNLTPEHFSRILNDLSKQGFIDVSGRQVAIENVDGLLAYAR